MPIFELHYKEDAVRSGWWPRLSLEIPAEEAVEAFRFQMHNLAWAMNRPVRVIERITDGPWGRPESFADEPLIVVTPEEARIHLIAGMDLDTPVLDADELAQIRRRMAVTPAGPWIEEKVNRLGAPYRMYAVPGVEWTDGATGGLQDFIAHSRMDLPAAMLEIERLQEKVRLLEMAVDKTSDPIPSPAR